MDKADKGSVQETVPEDRVIYKPENGTQIAYDKVNLETVSGEVVGFWDNGNLKHRKQYRYGELHGISEIFFEQGPLWMETPFKSGKRHGVLKTLWKNGLTMMTFDVQRWFE